MTTKTLKKTSSELALASIRKGTDKNATKNKQTPPSTLEPAVMEAWASIPQSVRSALITSEISSGNLSNYGTEPSTSILSSTSDSLSSSESDKSEVTEFHESCPQTGAKVVMKPLERAPKNVFSFIKTTEEETTSVKKECGATITTTTKIVSTGRGWRNVFNLPISYDVNVVSDGTLLDPANSQLLQATGVHPEGYDRRFALIDDAVDKIYGEQIRAYFVARGIELTTCVLAGGEPEKRPAAVDQLLDELCAYKLRRREPFLAIGGGVILDIAGMGACLYRRGVPFVRVPTTLLAIVDASVGVKNGVDYQCCLTDESYKNRVGSFYAPTSCLLDNAFIASQDTRNVANGVGEIVKLALVRSLDLFEILESHGAALIKSKFSAVDGVPEGVSERIIDLSIQIMLEELGPNLWESKLDRCVDYGHTFSKLLEMVPGTDIMHGEAVNIDGFFCIVLSYIRGYIGKETADRVFKCMKSLSLPTDSPDLTPDLAWQSCKDAVEHRHGEQRIPLITEIGESICVSDITAEELERAIDMMKTFDH